jgi:hypothetical protein
VSNFNIFRVAGKATLLALLVAFSITVVFPSHASAQSLIAGDIAGRVTDPSGAVVPDAVINLKSLDTGVTASTNTTSEGLFRFSLLKPGRYEVSANVKGFSAIALTVTVAVGQTSPADLSLEITRSSETIEVTTEMPLISLDPGNSTGFTQKEVSLLPSPGGDMTNIAFSTPGAVVNVTGGYGNFTANGMPATSNLFTVNGENDMDPYFNINNSGATNLTLGANEVQEATVTTNMYSGQYGTLMGSQVTYVTKSGTNTFHGNAQYWWNGRYLNANDFFSNATGSPRPFANANQWAAAVGGPIIKNKLFFFVDTEGLRFVLPNVDTVVSPSPQYQSAVLANIATVAPAELKTYQQLFNLYTNAKGFSGATPFTNTTGCDHLVLPGWVSGTPCAVSYTATPTSFASEWILAARVDFVATSKDNMFFRYKLDHGVQPSYIDPISANFDANSNQPSYDGQYVWSHVFSPTLTNSFTAAGSHYVAQFAQNHALAASTFPTAVTYAGSLPFTTGVTNFSGILNPMEAFPQGRNVTQYQFIDDVSWNKGKNAWKFGINFRRYDVSDHNFFYNSPLVYFRNVGGLADPTNNGIQSFADGLAFQYRQADNLASDVPIALWGLGFYGEDQIKLKSNLTLTLALRFERNSNPVCQINCFANFTGSFNSLASVQAGAGAGDVPYSQDIKYNQHQAFPGVDALDVSPRVAFSWAPNKSDALPWLPGGGKTVISGGYGLFYDSLPAGLVDPPNLLANPPISIALRVHPNPNTGVYPWDPAGAPATFAAGVAAFNINESYNQISNNLANVGVAFTSPAFTSIVGTMHAPRAQEWNLMVQQQIGKTTSFTFNYVGNSVTRLPYGNAWPNAYDPFGIYPGTSPTAAVPNYGTVTQVQSGAISNYNALNVTVQERIGSQFVAHFNYTYGHNLDEASNGGVFTYGDSVLGQINPLSLRANNYGNSDYDVRHNFSMDYVYTPNWKFQNKALSLLVGGWQWSGKLFWRTGLPFTVTDNNLSGLVLNGGFPAGGQPVQQITGAPQSSCGASSNYTNGDAVFGSTACLNPNAFINTGAASFTNYTTFPTETRNQFRGPGYFDMDMALYKNFAIKEHVNLGIGMNAFNVFNHPNFALPDNGLGDSTFGQITSTVGVPTSPYGNFLGFDSSVRVVQLTAKLTF